MKTTSGKIRLPTILGIIILVFGLASGVFLTRAKQIFKIGAFADTTPKNIRVSNISDSQFSISFTTDQETFSSVKVSSDKLFLGRIDTKKSSGKQVTHYYNFEGAVADHDYYAIVNVNGIDYGEDDPLTFKTGVEIFGEQEAKVIYGKVFSKSGEEQKNALVYAQCGNGNLLSTISSDDGTWTLTVSKTRSADLSAYEPIDEQKTLISLLILYGQTTSTITTHIINAKPLPPIVLGTNIDLRNSTISKIYDLPSANVFGTSSATPLPHFVKSVFKERNSFIP